jgi:hypothetical protein
MSFAGRPLLPGSSTPASPVVVTSSGQTERNFPVSTSTVLIIAGLIILAVILWTVYEVRKIPVTITQLPVETGIYNLDNLTSLNGQLCCVQAPSVLPNPTYIYDPTTNFTYSPTKVTPAVACQAATGLANTTCLTAVTAPDGTTLPLAHYGITIYYPFSYGGVPTVCSSYTPC